MRLSRLVGGGLVSFWGPVIGVAVFLLTRDVVGAFTNSWMLWFGLLFVLVVLFRPEGIAGVVKSVMERRTLRGQGLSALRLIFRNG